MQRRVKKMKVYDYQVIAIYFVKCQNAVFDMKLLF